MAKSLETVGTAQGILVNFTQATSSAQECQELYQAMSSTLHGFTWFYLLIPLKFMVYPPVWGGQRCGNEVKMMRFVVAVECFWSGSGRPLG